MNPVSHVNGLYSQQDMFGDSSVESFHMTSGNDIVFPWGTNDHYHMDRSNRIIHLQGHKPPKYLESNHLAKFDYFLKRQFHRKYARIPMLDSSALQKVAKL